jgi:hypothetical protein
MTPKQVGRAWLITVVALLSIAGPAAPSGAQQRDVRYVSVGAAAGIATPFHGDFDFTAAAWQGDIRFHLSTHFAVSLMLEEWRHRDEQVSTDLTIVGPNGITGRADRVVSRTDHRTRSGGFNVLALGTAGRVTFSGGGGLSYLLYARDFRQTTTGCQPPSACGDTSRDFNNSSFAGQVQAGIDVAVAPRVAVMAEFRLLVPVRDPGGGHNTFMAGVRFGF